MAIQRDSEIALLSAVQDLDNHASDADVESGSDQEQPDNKHGMAAMGDIISKILEKSISSSDTILCKSQKSKKRKLEMKEEINAKKEKDEDRKEHREKNHVIPTRSNAQKEVLLKRIATKGVVKLFNAVTTHQKAVSEKMKVAKTESKKTKVEKDVSKSTFMDLLKSKQNVNKNVQKDLKQADGKDENEPSKKWDVLRDDFMMGASMKDWDKDDGDENEENPSNDDMDSDASDE